MTKSWMKALRHPDRRLPGESRPGEAGRSPERSRAGEGSRGVLAAPPQLSQVAPGFRLCRAEKDSRVFVSFRNFFLRNPGSASFALPLSYRICTERLVKKRRPRQGPSNT